MFQDVQSNRCKLRVWLKRHSLVVYVKVDVGGSFVVGVKREWRDQEVLSRRMGHRKLCVLGRNGNVI